MNPPLDTAKDAAPQTEVSASALAQGEGAVSPQGEPLSPSTASSRSAVAAPVVDRMLRYTRKVFYTRTKPRMRRA
jgi:hypothetical protein